MISVDTGVAAGADAAPVCAIVVSVKVHAVAILDLTTVLAP